MKANMLHNLVITLTLLMVIGWAIPVFAWDVQQAYWNTTGQTAYDLTKILWGSWPITNAIDHKFHQYAVFPFAGVTVLHFFDGQVPSGPNSGNFSDPNWTWACFNTTRSGTPVVDVYWTDQNGRRIGRAAVAVGTDASFTEDNVIIDVSHDGRDWIGDGYPPEPGDCPGDPLGQVTGMEVYYAVTHVMRPLDSLNVSLITDPPPDILWQPLSGFSLDYGDVESYALGSLDAGDVVLFRFMAESEGQTMFEMVQFRVADLDIPTLTEWGLIIFGVVLIGFITWVFLRRRRAVVSVP